MKLYVGICDILRYWSGKDRGEASTHPDAPEAVQERTRDDNSAE